MKTVQISNESILELTNNEMLAINGGTYQSGYAAGQEVGQYVKQALNDWGVLTTLKTIFELF